MPTYHEVSTIGQACELGSTDPGSFDTTELLRYQNVDDTGCKVVDNPILTYENNMCVLYEDLEAKTTPTLYTVTYNLNGHGTSTVPEPETGLTYGSFATKPSNPTDSSNQYDFTGWYTTDYQVQGETSWDFLNDKVTNNTTLYAHWVNKPSTTRALLWLNSGNNQNQSWGKKVTVNAGTVEIIGDLTDMYPNDQFYLGVYDNQLKKRPRRTKIYCSPKTVAEYYPTNHVTSTVNEYIAYVGETYRFLCGFDDTRVVAYGVKAIHTDTYNGETITTEEIIPFNDGEFNLDWTNYEGSYSTTTVVKELTFVAHQKTQLWLLCTAFPGS